MQAQLFGLFSIANSSGRPIRFPTEKAKGLFAYVVMHGQDEVLRSRLASLLWEESSESAAKASLRTELQRLKRALGEGSPLIITRQTVAVNGDSAEIDVYQYNKAWQQCQQVEISNWVNDPDTIERLKQLISLYQGDFLQGIEVKDSSGFDQWLTLSRSHFHSCQRAALGTLAKHSLQNEDPVSAQQHAEQLVAFEPEAELGHQLLMEAFHQQGENHLVIAQFEKLTKILQDTFGAPPSATTQKLYEAILNKSKPIQHNLPTLGSLTPFFGRKSELSDVVSLLQNRRLLSIVGMGGMGKTRLALSVCREVKGNFPDGVWVIDLTGLSSAQQLPLEILTVLGVKLSVQVSPRDQLLAYLKEKRMLLFFDNYEHLLPDTTLISELIRQTTDVAFLVTSRDRLRLQLEQIYPLGGLDVPDSAENVYAFDSAQLFLGRVQYVNPALTPAKLSQSETEAISQICELVAGHPLALELAAARTLFSSVEDVAADLAEDVAAFSAQHSDVPARQKSIQFILERTWEKLHKKEREILPYLAQFQGGFGLDAYQAITKSSERLLEQLVHKSLVQVNGIGRYSIHPMIRQFVVSKCTDSDKEQTAYYRYYLTFLQEKSKDLNGPLRLEAQALDSLTLEKNNILSAWHIGVNRREIASLNSAMEALAAYYGINKWGTDLTEIFEGNIAELNPYSGTNKQAARFVLMARFYIGIYDFRNPKTSFEKLVELEPAIEQLDDATLLASLYLAKDTFNHHSDFLSWKEKEENLLNGIRVLEENHQIARNLGGFYGRLGLMASSDGDVDLAIEYSNKAIAVYDKVGAEKASLIQKSNLSEAYLFNGDPLKGLFLAEEVEHAVRQSGYPNLSDFAQNKSRYLQSLYWLGKLKAGKKACLDMKDYADQEELNFPVFYFFFYHLYTDMLTALGEWELAADSAESVWAKGKETQFAGFLSATLLPSLFEAILFTGDFARFGELLSQFDFAQSSEGLGRLAFAIASWHLQSGRAEKALEIVTFAENSSDLNFIGDQAKLSCVKSLILHELGKSQSLEQSCQQMFALAEKSQFPPCMLKAELTAYRVGYVKDEAIPVKIANDARAFAVDRQVATLLL